MSKGNVQQPHGTALQAHGNKGLLAGVAPKAHGAHFLDDAGPELEIRNSSSTVGGGFNGSVADMDQYDVTAMTQYTQFRIFLF